MSRKVKVALCQRGLIFDAEENLKDCLAMMEQAVEEVPGTDIIVFPEFNLNFAMTIEQAHEVWLRQDGPVIKALAEKAKELHVNLITGSFAEDFGGVKARNTMVFIDREGNIKGSYSKMHLFNAMGIMEGDSIDAGNEICVIDTDFGRIGMALCYDIRFPELSRMMALDGAEMVFVSAMFAGGNPLPLRSDQWDVMVRSIALENGLWACACNQFGEIDGSFHFGRSQVVDPWGTPVAFAGGHKDIVHGFVDLDYNQQVRNKLGMLSNRRPELYKIN